MGNGPVERDNPKKGVIKSGEFKGEEVIFTPNGDIRFTGNDSAGGTSGDPGTTYRNLGNGKYGSSRGLLDVEPKKEVAEDVPMIEDISEIKDTPVLKDNEEPEEM